MLRDVSAAVTLLGSSVLLLPLSVLLAAVLWRQHSARLALRWIAVLGACLLGMAALKLYGHACGLPILLRRVVSPSGHAAFSALFYGSLAAVMLRAVDIPWRRTLLMAGTAGLVAAIGLSRILLRAHTKLEVLIGLSVGAAAALAFALSIRSLPPARLRLRPAAAGAVLACGLAALAVGDRSVIEETIRALADEVQQEVGLCMTGPSDLAALRTR
ncbi:phosphatase PAP2 family protein [Azospirillum thermophilum]|nr:phosphatase PAP2 family protein [Azospirillum thermophilum]